MFQTWKDAAHSCAIEVDDDGCLLTVILTDDLVGSDLRFGRQHIMFYPEADRLELGEFLALCCVLTNLCATV